MDARCEDCDDMLICPSCEIAAIELRPSSKKSAEFETARAQVYEVAEKLGLLPWLDGRFSQLDDVLIVSAESASNMMRMFEAAKADSDRYLAAEKEHCTIDDHFGDNPPLVERLLAVQAALERALRTGG